MIWTCLTIETLPPTPLSRTSPRQSPAPLLRHVEDGVSDGGSALMGVVYRGDGGQFSGRAMQSAVVNGVVVGGCGHGCTIVKLGTFLKRGVGLVIKRANIV